MRTAVLGTGVMGAAMARSLAREGHQVAAWNRTPERARPLADDTITVCSSVAEAVTGADAVVTMVFDTDSVLALTDELVGALAGEAVWLQSSTVGPAGITRIAEAAGEAAERLVDAPVLGTRKPAEDGALVVLASGPESALAAARPVFDAIGSRTVVAGDGHGPASALKLACNSWVALVNAGVGQALGLTEALGLDPNLFLEAIGGGATDTPYAHVKGAAMMSRTFTPVSFALDGVRKDTGLMVEAARDAGFPDDLLAAVLAVYDRAAERGHGEEDMAAVRAAFDG